MLWNLLLTLVVITTVSGDVYLQGPRGSNNRLNEEGRERNNANRLFDSQNNNRGGYNQGNLYYYTGSTVQIEWTNQHSCGDPNNHCELVVQYMCGDLVRDGTTTNTIPSNRWDCDRADCNTDMEYGMHESFEYYQECKARERNKGLFTADQQLKGHGAKYTRQNNNGNRRGYECPEERDYYPYWHPTDWRDIAVFTNDVSRCDYYKAESQNVKAKGYCKYPDNFLAYKESQGININNDVRMMNNKAACESHSVEHGGEYITPVWVEKPSWNIDPPTCMASPWSRDNHHGNNMDGFMNNYNWTVPSDLIHKNCVMRLRYNITSGELNDGGFDPAINASLNVEKDDDPIPGIDVATMHGLPTENERGYVFQQDPIVKVFTFEDDSLPEDILNLEVTLNTNQHGRTFEDRTHVFEIRERPADIPASATIHNLNVRGKRGNIVQTYPGVEYDFQPNRLEMKTDDYIHPQWTGANSNPGNNAGNGRAGTDRSNMALLREITWPKEGAYEDPAHGCFACNYPEIFSPTTNFMGLNRDDLMALAYHTNYHNYGDIDELDDMSTYFDLGPRKITKAGIFRYLCTRNNDFTNRSQKAEIRVIQK